MLGVDDEWLDADDGWSRQDQAMELPSLYTPSSSALSPLMPEARFSVSQPLPVFLRLPANASRRPRNGVGLNNPLPETGTSRGPHSSQQNLRDRCDGVHLSTVGCTPESALHNNACRDKESPSGWMDGQRVTARPVSLVGRDDAQTGSPLQQRRCIAVLKVLTVSQLR